MFQMKQAESRIWVTIIVYISLFLDNILLTVIVPILPDYLSLENSKKMPASVVYKNYDLHYVSKVMGDTILTSKNNTLNQHIVENAVNSSLLSANDFYNEENVSIGMLLGIKAIIQLIFNPIVGSLTTKFGYRLPILFGTGNLLIASLGKSFESFKPKRYF